MKAIYPDIQNKMWLVMQSSKTAKTISVEEEGIGEELPFTLFGWVNDDLTIICQTSVALLDKKQRFDAIIQAAVIFRKAWGCTSLSFVAEGFCATDPTAIRYDQPLAIQFASGNQTVMECLTVMHVESNSINILTVPYKYGLGRTVSYGKPRMYPQNGDTAYSYPTLLRSTLGLTPELVPEYSDVFY